MDETKKPSINEVLEQPKLRSEIDQKTVGFRATAAAADDVSAEILANLNKLAGIGGETEKVKKTLNSCNPGKQEHAYPNLSKGKLLFQTEEYQAPKEYIVLQMNENKELVKKILDEKGCLTGHPEIPCPTMQWDMPKLDQIYAAVKDEFPDEKAMIVKNKDITDKISTLLGGVQVSFNRSNYHLMVKTAETKFDIREINAAVKALANLFPEKEAEKIVAREIAKKIQNVL